MKKKTRKQRRQAAATTETKIKKMKDSKGAKEFSIPLYDSKGKAVGVMALSKKIFNGEVNKKVLYQAVVMYNANRRHGNASTKTRSNVSGGGKKPWRQKGTGRARAGSSRSPLWRGGGIIFGPHPRDFSYSMPRKVKRLAFLSSINSKLNENKIIGIDAVVMDEPKTKRFKAVMDALKLEGKSLFVLDKIDENVKRASNNLVGVAVKNYRDFNTMDVLNCDNIVMSKSALEKLPERFKD